MKVFAILTMLFLCSGFECATTRNSSEISKKLQLFSVDIQTEIGDFLKSFLDSLTAFFGKFKQSNGTTTVPPASRRWQGIGR
jgi:ubiquitin C-terminal hydrolase